MRRGCCAMSLSCVRLFVTPWTVARQAPLSIKILEWVAVSFSRGSSRPRDGTWVSRTAGGFFTTEPPGKPQSLCVYPLSTTHWQLPWAASVHLCKDSIKRCDSCRPSAFPERGSAWTAGGKDWQDRSSGGWVFSGAHFTSPVISSPHI